MERFFLFSYRYFSRHRAFLWLLLALSGAVFLFFAVRMQYEEDISKLLPPSENEDINLTFNSLKVKDKLFFQFVPDEGVAEPELIRQVDRFMETLTRSDSTGRLIADVLYRIEPETALNALDFALSHLPSLVDTSLYPAVDRAIASARVSMERNYDALMADETGSASRMISLDPLELRTLLLPPGGLSGNGFSVRGGHLFSATGSTALAFLSPSFSYQNSRECEALMRLIREALPEVQGAQVLLHGAPVRSIDNSRTIKRDLAMTTGLAFLVIILLLCLSFKSFRFFWQNLLPLLYGTAFALAVLYLVKGSISLMALGISAVVLGVTISYCLHLLIHHRFVGNVEKLLRDETVPILLSCLTTMGAFAGLLLTRSQLLKDFGLFAGLALAGSTFFILFFLPHFLQEGDLRKSDAALRLADRFNRLPLDRNPVYLTLLCAVILLSIAFSGRVRFDSDLRNIGYESPALKEAQERYARENLGRNVQQYYAAAGATPEQAWEHAQGLLRALEPLLRDNPDIRCNDAALRLFIPPEQQRERIRAWEQFWTPEKKEEARQAVTRQALSKGLDPSLFAPFFALLDVSYTPASLYDAGIVPDGLRSNWIEASGGRYLLFCPVTMPPAMKQTVSDAVAAVPHAIVIDPIYYAESLVSVIHNDFQTALWISSLFVALVLLLSLRSLRLALLAFLPMGLSWYVTQGLMALSGLPFNMINIVISTFVFGIGVDYSIFVMQGLLAQSSGRDTRLLEYHRTAIFFSALVLLGAVGSLVLARHPAIRSIGACTLIGMTSTILITYSLLPLLFNIPPCSGKGRARGRILRHRSGYRK